MVAWLLLAFCLTSNSPALFFPVFECLYCVLYNPVTALCMQLFVMFE